MVGHNSPSSNHYRDRNKFHTSRANLSPAAAVVDESCKERERMPCSPVQEEEGAGQRSNNSYGEG